MHFYAAPSDEDALTLTSPFRALTFKNGKLEKRGYAEIVMQVRDHGEFRGHWETMLWCYAYDNDVTSLRGSKRRGHMVYAKNVGHPAYTDQGMYYVETSGDTLFYELTYEQRTRGD